VKENKQHFSWKFKDDNSDIPGNKGARILNLATYDVGYDKKHTFMVKFKEGTLKNIDVIQKVLKSCKPLRA
jgi:L-ribulose-5-phosphate 3-epimerase UlaE